jgi:hypothetical protein
MAVQHRGTLGNKTGKDEVDVLDISGKEQIPKGMLSMLKSQLSGISTQDFLSVGVMMKRECFMFMN